MTRHALLRLAPVVLATLAGGGLTAACTGGSEGDPRTDEKAWDTCAASVPKPTEGTTLDNSAKSYGIALAPTDAESVKQALREALVREMNGELARGKYAALVKARCGDRPTQDRTNGAGGSSSGSSGNGAAPAPEAPGGEASQASGTNNQIAGVDEADFVKNDNKYIYVATNGRFRIIEAWPATTAHEIANVAIEGEVKKLFVTETRALVYSSVPPGQGTMTSPSSGRGGGGGGAGGCSSYGYGCVPSGDGTGTVLTLLDITDKTAPKVVRRIESSSSLLAARRIGDTVHTVLIGEPRLARSWSLNPSASTTTEADVHAAYDALAKANEAAIANTPIDAALPTLKDSGGAEPGRAFFKSQLPDGAAFTTVLSVDIAPSQGGFSAVTVISRAGHIFASPNALYMAVPHNRADGYGWYDGRTESELSTIHKFAIGNQAAITTYKGSGAVKGRTLNQFAMDEKDGRVRIATTSGHLPSPDAENTLSIMEEVPGGLGVVGQLDGIAKTEDIRSVRFDGDRGYVVTFKKTDPLFVFDLADPKAPKVLGELKIPGFSTYMHMMDPTHLLTIGYDAADQGDFAYFTGVLLQIFDVSNPASPTLAHKEIIGTRGSSSEALADHLAFNYFAPKDLLAIPMTICEGGGTQGNYGTNMTFSGLLVYDTKATTGFNLKGKVAHPNSANGTGYDNAGCSNWWANASSEVKRSIIMDDYVFSVSGTRIKVNRLDALGTGVKELPSK